MFAFVKNEPEGATCWALPLPATFQCPEPDSVVTVLLAKSGLAEDVTSAGDFVFGMAGDRLVLVGEVVRMRTRAGLQPVLATLPPVVLTAVAVRVMPYDLAVLDDPAHRLSYYHRGLRAALSDEVAKATRGGLDHVAWSLGYSGVCWDVLEVLENAFEKV